VEDRRVEDMEGWKKEVGSQVRLAIYTVEQGWKWKMYKVLNYFPHVVHCIDEYGINMCFTYWEFKGRQKGAIDSVHGGPNDNRNIGFV
jgi:hypothetical protein